MGAPWTETAGGAQARPGLRPGPVPGSWQLGGPDAPLIAAIGFRDRSEALALALRSPRPAQTALAHLRALALRREGRSDQDALDLAILDLAGAETEDGLPGFVETALCVARGTGLALSEIAAAPAAEIDAMARVLLQGSEGEGTTRIVFAAAAAPDAAGEIEARLQVLLRRAAAPAPIAPGIAGTAAPAGPTSVPTAPAVAPQVEESRTEPAMAGPRPFRLAPKGRTPQAGPAQPAPSTARLLSGALELPPPASAAESPAQPTRRAAFSLVPGARTEPRAAPTRMDQPVSPPARWPSSMPGELSGRTAGAAALAPPLAPERSRIPGQKPSPLSPLRLADWPQARGATSAGAAAEAMAAAASSTASPWPAAPPQTTAFLDALAAALQDEADLRGLAP